MKDALSDIQTSIAALLAAQSAPKRGRLPDEKHRDTGSTRDPPDTTPPARSRLRPGLPTEFAGERKKGRAFLDSCTMYMEICYAEFATEQAKILWALSYMKGGRASDFTHTILEYKRTKGRDYYPTWLAFHAALVAKFCPKNEATTALLRLESERYYQGKRTVEEYLDEFETLVNRSGYQDDLGIVMKFRRGLNREIHDKIAESGKDTRPPDDRPDLWYEAATHLSG
jgi:hypothetical protein